MTLSVNAILKSVIAIMAAAIVATLAVGAWSSWNRVAVANKIADVAEATAHMFTALHNLRVDRASTVRDLRTDKQFSSLTQRIVDARNAQMPALRSALAAMERVDFPERQASVTSLRQAIDRLTALHKESVVAVTQPLASRRAGLAQEHFKETSDLLNLLDKLSSQLSRSIKLQDPFIDQLMEMKYLAWVARNAGGDASVMISNGMSGQPMPPDPLLKYAGHVAVANASWAALQEVANGLSMPAKFTEALAKANKEYFGSDFVELRGRMLKAVVEGTKPELPLQQWTLMTVPKLATVLNVAEAALDVAKEHAAEQHADAMAKLWLQAGLLLAALAFAGGLMFLITYRITSPLRQIQQAMLKVATGDFDVVLPGLHRKDEIGDVANAVERFKVLAVEKAHQESEEMMKRQKAEAERQAEVARAEALAREKAAEAQRKQAEAQAEAQAKVAEEQRKNAEAASKAADEQAHIVQLLAEALGKVSEGDLTVRLPDGIGGAYAKIRTDFNTMVSRLHETIAIIVNSAREVTNAAAEISGSTTNLSQRTEEQAAGLEQTSASMEQIFGIVKNNAANAKQANQLTTGTRDVADRGGAVVGQAVDAMARIEESSRKIGEIIGVIDEIARQTNLLALNAAVEAARAGDAGRGFAVVASEVRNLAQRSSQAAKDIKDLITNSSSQVKEGVDLVNRAGKSLEEIVESIKKVSEIVADITNASDEQATGLDQINKALNQLDDVTQQNSAVVEQNAATAKTLEQQSAAMAEQVSFFTISQADAGRPAVRAA